MNINNYSNCGAFSKEYQVQKASLLTVRVVGRNGNSSRIL